MADRTLEINSQYNFTNPFNSNTGFPILTSSLNVNLSRFPMKSIPILFAVNPIAFNCKIIASHHSLFDKNNNKIKVVLFDENVHVVQAWGYIVVVGFFCNGCVCVLSNIVSHQLTWLTYEYYFCPAQEKCKDEDLFMFYGINNIMIFFIGTSWVGGFWTAGRSWWVTKCRNVVFIRKYSYNTPSSTCCRYYFRKRCVFIENHSRQWMSLEIIAHFFFS